MVLTNTSTVDEGRTDLLAGHFLFLWHGWHVNR